jgi:diaminopimelate epimerase
MTAARLSKLHATGNDFLVWSWLGPDGAANHPVTASQARALCDRHTGIGADGLIIAMPGSDGADAKMLLFNADGGIAEMSGNGMRTLAWVVARTGRGANGALTVDTGGGRRQVELTRDPSTSEVSHATVDMGAVTFDPALIPVKVESPFGITADYHGTQYEGDAAGMGNPHLVLFVDDPATARVTQHGPHLEHDERFPKRTNVEFVRATPGATDEIDMRVWERGVGETLSCGTGACAVAAVAHERGLVGERVTVHVPGGDLTVELGDTIRLGGPVVHVFDVEVDLQQLELS